MSVPTIGIGCGDHTCDGEIAVITDLLGSFPWFVPPFAKPEADVAGSTRDAVAKYLFESPRSVTGTSHPSCLLYLHIPFCHRVCPYCSFYKHTPGSTPIGAFVDALAVEARKRITSPARTLYLGGGTPSMLSPGHLDALVFRAA